MVLVLGRQCGSLRVENFIANRTRIWSKSSARANGSFSTSGLLCTFCPRLRYTSPVWIKILCSQLPADLRYPALVRGEIRLRFPDPNLQR